MNLLAPESLLWAVALVPPLILLYFLKIRRAPVIIPSIMLWRKSLHDLKANAPFQRLRRNLLLFLQLLVLAALILAMARPVSRGSAFSGKNLILLVDRSASMMARDGGSSTRFERALSTAEKIADDPERGEVMIVSFSSKAAVELPFTASSVEIGRALAGMRCAGTRTSIAEALKIAKAASSGRSDCVAVILSDGAFGPIPDLGERGFKMELVKIGSGSDNRGITGLSVRRPAEDPSGGVSLFVEVSNFSPRPGEVTLEILHEGSPVDAAKLSLAPGAAQGTTFDLDAVTDGMLTVRIGPADDLGVDDEARVLVLPGRAPRVLLRTRGNVFLENALATIPGVKLTISPLSAPFPEERFDVAVFDSEAPAEMPPVKGMICFGCAPPGFGCAVMGEVETPLFGNGDWNESHPVNRYVDFSGLFVRKALKATLPANSVTLLESREGPLAAAFENSKARAVAVFFGLQDTDWPFMVSFPVFLHNAVFWAYGGGASTDGVWYRAGDPVEVQAQGGVSVADPEGKPVALAGGGDEAPVISSTEKTGVYVASLGDGREWRIPVNLVDPAESDIAPVDKIEMPGEEVKAISSREAGNREYWQWLLLAAVALLLVEWWVYNRRLA